MKATELNSRNKRNEIHAKEFKSWVKSKNVEVSNSVPGVDLKVGQKVTYTNDYGVKFEGYTILGFCTPDNGRCVFLNKDSYWFPVDPKNLTIENKEDEPKTPAIGQYVYDIHYNRKTKVTGIANGLYFIGPDHEPVRRHEFIFPLPRK